MSNLTPLTQEELAEIEVRVNHPAWVALDKLVGIDNLSPSNKMSMQSRIDARRLLGFVGYLQADAR